MYQIWYEWHYRAKDKNPISWKKMQIIILESCYTYTKWTKVLRDFYFTLARYFLTIMSIHIHISSPLPFLLGHTFIHCLLMADVHKPFARRGVVAQTQTFPSTQSWLYSCSLETAHILYARNKANVWTKMYRMCICRWLQNMCRYLKAE